MMQKEVFDIIKSKRHYLMSVIFGFLGIMLILMATARYGTGLSSDSVTYIFAAQSISSGHGYYDNYGGPVLVFPPLFSTLLALIGRQQLELDIVARYLNAIFFGLIVAVSAHWLLTHTKSIFISLIGTAAIIFSKPLLEVSSYAWSEPLFNLLTLLALFQMARFLASQKYWPVVLAGVFAALACLTRYVGITLLLTGGLLLVLLRYQYTFIQCARRLEVYTIVGVSPLGIWLLRNYSLSGTLTGYRVESKRSLTTGIRLTADTLSSWLLPNLLPFWFRVTVIGLLLLGFILITILIVRGGNTKAYHFQWNQIFPFILFAVVYLTFLNIAESSINISPIDNRFLGPIYVPLVLSSILLVDKLTQTRLPFFHKQTVRVVLLLGLALWLIYPVANTVVLVEWQLVHGAGGFHSRRWMDSELMSYLKEDKPSGVIYTNGRAAVYALTGNLFEKSPRKYEYESLIPTDDLIYFEQVLQRHGHVYLIMFDTYWPEDYLYSPEFFKSKYALDEILTAQDGKIYRVELRLPDQKDLVIDGIRSGQ